MLSVAIIIVGEAVVQGCDRESARAVGLVLVSRSGVGSHNLAMSWLPRERKETQTVGVVIPWPHSLAVSHLQSFIHI